MKAIITVGLGFGDEGKGATVDFLVRELGAELVVRYSGGGQAGHNVELPDGRRHTFSQFSAGTFAGAQTYLGPRMIISPATLAPEAEHLESLGVDDPWTRICVHPDCLVSTTYPVLMNRLRELDRGDDRHGSCGLGVGETRHYWLRNGQDAVFASDLRDRSSLLKKLALMRDRYLLEMQELRHLDAELATMLHDSTPADEAHSLLQTANRLEITRRIPPCRTVIFEGAQGVLLDEWRGFHPHTTWSTVTPLHALEMLQELPVDDTLVLGITRAYSTRHGAGPFPTWCTRMSTEMADPGNRPNDWQGAMRFGPLDLVLTEYAARACEVDGIFVNCVDQLSDCPRLVSAYENLNRLPMPRSLREQVQLTQLLESAVPIEKETSANEILESLAEIAPVVGIGHGATHVDRDLVEWPARMLGKGSSHAGQVRHGSETPISLLMGEPDWEARGQPPNVRSSARGLT